MDLGVVPAFWHNPALLNRIELHVGPVRNVTSSKSDAPPNLVLKNIQEIGRRKWLLLARIRPRGSL